MNSTDRWELHRVRDFQRGSGWDHRVVGRRSWHLERDSCSPEVRFQVKIHSQTSQDTAAHRTWFLDATLYPRKKMGGRLPNLQLHGIYNFLRRNISKLWHIKSSSVHRDLNTNAHTSDILDSMAFKTQLHLHLCACNWELVDTLIMKIVHDAFFHTFCWHCLHD